MNFKFERTDFYLLLAYYVVVIPISLLDYEDYADKMELVYEITSFAITDTICSLVIIFVLFPIFIPKRQYFRLLLSMVGFLLIMGHIFTNVYCYFSSNCIGNWLSFKAAYVGLYNIGESFAILGVLLLGKKLYDAQLNFIKMEKEKKESELLRLNAQIDPHFLFNNLNTIDSLIDTDPKAAKVYLNKLSQLYRYLISSKDQEVIELEEELRFVQNYIYLIQSRFGNAFQFEIKQESLEANTSFIPPGALQTLLENIVKHNQASPSNPIKSTIIVSEKGIEVSNNLIPKKTRVDSTKTGLQNLKARYKLLTDEEVRIEIANNFVVKLPLLKQVA